MTCFRDWVFETGTRVLSTINVVLLCGWMFALIHDYKPYIIPAFNPSRQIPSSAIIAVLAIVIVGTLAFFHSNTARAKVLNGALMLWTSLLWALLSFHVWHDYPPLTPQMTIYPCLSLLSWLCGTMNFEEGRRNKKDYLIKKGE
ncbi:hypothetical protein [Basilea psittacipulmonis]|nr:hypothetical protein [Basilea psittacipulmonis]